jgi:hypothetical protein
MTDHTDNEYPSNWHAGGGEASRPLHEGGYYMHLYYRVLPGSNQHVERFLELRVDTSGGRAPDTHHAVLTYCTEDGVDVTREDLLDRATVDVDDPTSEADQDGAEATIHQKAEAMMAEYADWTPE